MKKITQENVKEFFKTGKKMIDNASFKIADIILTQEYSIGFSDGIEIGITNTIDSLYLANISDKEIVRIVCEQWGINSSEVKKRLEWEKGQVTINALKEYLRLKGYSDKKIIEFMRDKNANQRIRKNSEMWKLKDKPEELYKKITNN